jgi:hypothetical protein
MCASRPWCPTGKVGYIFQDEGRVHPGSIQVPTFYLGVKLKKTVLPNGVVAWGISSRNISALPGDQKLLKKASGPFTGGYTPELDESPELDSIRANF